MPSGDRLKTNDQLEQLCLVTNHRANRPTRAESQRVLDDEKQQTKQLHSFQGPAPRGGVHLALRHRAQDEAQRRSDDSQQYQIRQKLGQIRGVWVLKRKVYPLPERQVDRQLCFAIHTEELGPSHGPITVHIVLPGIEAVHFSKGEEQALHCNLKSLQRNFLVVGASVPAPTVLPLLQLAEDRSKEQQLHRLARRDQPCLSLRPHLRGEHANARMVLQPWRRRHQIARVRRACRTC
mmetsp:Transcript_32829/g.94181  ORF Transcript_32829/g.94181 Transcript_32829/m.94181 type:complete len:236 (+) Transcript_32829:937-1644(+)